MTRQLPAGTCITHALSSVRNNLAYAFRISWPWYAIMTPIVVVLMLLLNYVTAGNPEASPGTSALINLVRGLITMLAFASVAVNWHRYILLDEVPSGSEVLRLDDKTWRYFGNALLLFLIILVTGIVIGFPAGFIGALFGSPEAVTIIVALIVAPVAGVMALRLGTKFPAIALGRPDFSMRDAWSATKGNNWPIFLVVLFEVVAIALSFGLLMLVAYIAGMISLTLSFIIVIALGIAFNWIITIFSITVLTSLYGFFVEGRDF